MLESIVSFSVRRRALVLTVTAVLVAVGLYLVPKLPIDAVPDVTNVQVVILTEAAGLSAEEMERFVTYSVEMGLNGLPQLEEMRRRNAAGPGAAPST